MIMILTVNRINFYLTYHEDLEKRGRCGVVARETRESRVQWAKLLAKEKQPKILPLFKILADETKTVV